jgi:hypothetical protein
MQAPRLLESTRRLAAALDASLQTTRPALHETPLPGEETPSR